MRFCCAKINLLHATMRMPAGNGQAERGVEVQLIQLFFGNRECMPRMQE